MQDLELKKKRIETIAKVGGLGVIGFLVAPVIFLTIKGIIGLAIAAGIGVTLINFTPWFAAKLANWRLKALKHEAMKNPIETLQNNYKVRMESLQKFRDAINTFSSEIKSFAEKLVSFKKQYPDEADKFDGQLVQMKQLLSIRSGKYQEAKANLEQYELEIQKADSIWQMATAAAAMSKAAGVDADEFYAKIQVETALDSVQKSMNVAFSELELSLLDEKPAKAIALPREDQPQTQADHLQRLRQ